MGMDFMNTFYIKYISEEDNKRVFIKKVINSILNRCRNSFGDLECLGYFEGEPPHPRVKKCSIEEAVEAFLKKELDFLTFLFANDVAFDLDFAQWMFEEIKKVSISLEDFQYTSRWYDEKIKDYDEEGKRDFSLKMLDLYKTLYELVQPFYGFGNNMEYIEIKTKYEDAEAGDIKAVYWSNFFGPKLVEKYGRERLLSAPSYITEQLSDGGIMLVRSPNPFTIDEPYIKAEVIEEYLGIKDQKGG